MQILLVNSVFQKVKGVKQLALGVASITRFIKKLFGLDQVLLNTDSLLVTDAQPFN